MNENLIFVSAIHYHASMLLRSLIKVGLKANIPRVTEKKSSTNISLVLLDSFGIHMGHDYTTIWSHYSVKNIEHGVLGKKRYV